MILALAGGVGGARLAKGLANILPGGELTIAVNTGDDFDHLGLRICPDIDTVTHTLAARNDEERGWGVRGESWNFMEELRALGGPDWFALGDRDLAKHVLRSQRLRAGEPLSQVTADFAAHLGIKHNIVPMTDDFVQTVIDTDEGELAFQSYFVEYRCRPKFIGWRCVGATSAHASNGLRHAFDDPNLQSIIICPSNPFLSIGPFLAIDDIRYALQNRSVPCVAVSPFIGGEAVKGPAAKIFRELGQRPGSESLARYYDGLIDGILCDEADPAAGEILSGIQIKATDTLMRDDADRARLATETIAFARALRTTG